MPQTSLLGWLNKPTSVVESNSTKGSSDEPSTDERLPTPASAPPNDPSPSGSPLNGQIITPKPTLDHVKWHLPANVELRPCKKEDIPHLKRLNSLLLPIQYPEKFYHDIIDDSITSYLTLLAIWNDDAKASATEKGQLVGAIRCRLLNQLPTLNPTPEPRKEGPLLYLSTLVLLSPYRGHGIATRMLEIMTMRAVDEYGITSIGAHVWEANAEGLDWYRKRGFRELAREELYYRRLSPPGAVVMMRDVGVMDLINR